MPPFKPPGLKIVTETDVMLATGGGAGSLKDSEASWDVKADGNVCMLGKSMKGTYVFGEQGLISAAGTEAPHYKVYKGYMMDMRKFVAVKRVNATNREQRQQMLRDIKILSDAQAVPGLLSFLGAYLVPKKEQVHRDIKPANILMSLSGEAKLSDFGISATVEHTFAQVLQGDPPLPAPGTVSELCRDFLAACLQRDPTQRPPASVLLHHPWITQASPVNLKGLVRETMFSRDDK
eukprot:gene10657-10816_t